MKNRLMETGNITCNNGYKTQTKRINKNITVEKVDIISNDASKLSGYEKGKYRVIKFKYKNLFSCYAKVVDELKNILAEMVNNYGRVFVVGLGNREIVCDSLGAKVVDKILKVNSPKIYNTKNIVQGIVPNVLGVTGIESYDIIFGVTKQINPNLIICIDTLSASNFNNLFCSLQISNTSIIPGSGVKNSRKTLSEKTLNIPIIVIGVPMLISINNLLNSFNAKSTLLKDEMWLSPKDVDFAVEEFSYIISKAINEFFYPELNKDDIEKMVKGIF